MVHAHVDAPLLIVERLRGREQSGEAVRLGQKKVLDAGPEKLLEAVVDTPLEPGVLPHALNPRLGAAVGLVGHEQTQGGGIAAVVVVGDVVVPQRAEEETVVAALLIEIGAVEAVDVGRQLRADVPVDERGRIDKSPVAPLGIGERRRRQGTLETGDVLLDVGGLARENVLIVRIMDAHGRVVYSGAEAVAVHEAVRLQKIAARDVVAGGQRHRLLRDVHTVGTHLHLVADLIGALIDAVEREIDKTHRGIEGQRLGFGRPAQGGAEETHLRGQSITYQRLVAGIGQERPLLGVGVALAQKLLLIQKLEAIGLLGQPPRGVAAAAHGD